MNHPGFKCDLDKKVPAQCSKCGVNFTITILQRAIGYHQTSMDGTILCDTHYQEWAAEIEAERKRQEQQWAAEDAAV